MILQEGQLQFNFIDALDGFKFDEEDKSSARFHGLSHCMKAVDFVVEYHDYYLFVEIKNPKEPDRYSNISDQSQLIKDLACKFRDTFLYRWAEEKSDKSIRYQCLVETDHALTLYLMEQLKIELPVKKLPSRWKRNLVDFCSVCNLAAWNATFTNIPVKKI